MTAKAKEAQKAAEEADTLAKGTKEVIGPDGELQKLAEEVLKNDTDGGNADYGQDRSDTSRNDRNHRAKERRSQPRFQRAELV